MGHKYKILRTSKTTYTFGRWICLAAISLSLILQGCVTPPTPIPTEPEAPEVREEPAATDTEEVAEEPSEEESEEETSEEASEEEISAEELPWCDPVDDLYALLPPIGDPDAAGISVEICVQDGAAYSLETYQGTYEEIEYTKVYSRPFDIYALITYFKIYNGEELVTSFDPPLLMRISYTTEAWDEILTREDAGPRVAFLGSYNEIWIEPWIEFVDEIYQTTAPDSEDPDSVGIIEIIIEELPDPLIGGC